MMKLPESFDQNEWLLTITLIVVIALFWLLPKRFPWTIRIMIFVVTMFIGKCADTLLALEPNNLYDINDSHLFEIYDFITWFTYAFFGYFLVYLYDLLRPEKFHLWLYIIAWALISAGFEWFSVKMGVFHYNGWNIALSFVFYLFATSTVLLYFRFVQKKFQQSAK